MLCFVAKTNKEYCMINTLVATMPDGRKYIFDRDTTKYSIEDNGDLFMDWYGIYLWDADDIHIDGDEPFYIDIKSDFFKDIFEKATLFFELEDDADEDYRVTLVDLYC